MEKSQLPGVAGRGRERPRGPSVLESVMDPGRSHDLGISHVGAAASSTEKCGTQAGRGLAFVSSQDEHCLVLSSNT